MFGIKEQTYQNLSRF